MSEDKQHLLPYTVDPVIGPLEDRVPGFLDKRGDWKKLKKICGNGTWKDGTPIKVGVGDTGISHDHMESGDLKNAIGKDFTGSRSGFNDLQGHGSHVSCHIGARDDGQGIEGLASKCQIVHAKVLGDSGSGSSAGIRAGVDWMGNNQGCKIINLSLGGGGYSSAADRLYKELDAKGVLVFASMGNSGQGGERGGYPGRYDSTIGVTAVDYNKRLAGFSSESRGATLTGYGVQVLSCVARGSYARYSGTSMSCPDQAGIAALLVGYFDRKGIAVKNKDHYIKLIKDAGAFEDLGRAGQDTFYGHGFIDIWKVIDHYGMPEEGETPEQPEPEFVSGKRIYTLDLKILGKYHLIREIKESADERVCGEIIFDIDIPLVGHYAVVRVSDFEQNCGEVIKDLDFGILGRFAIVKLED